MKALPETQVSIGAIAIHPLPLFQPRSLILVILALAIPILGAIAGYDLQDQILALGGFIAAGILFIVIDYLRIRDILAKSVLHLQLPTRCYSGLSTTIQARFTGEQFAGSVRALRIPILTSCREGADTWDIFSITTPSICARCSITPLARGELVLESLLVRILGSGGIYQVQAELPFSEAVKISIIPNPGTNQYKSELALRSSLAGELSTAGRYHTGREFDSLRKYVMGDDLRKVDWKRSAKGHGLLVKTYRPETHQRIHLVFDCGRGLSSMVEGRPQIEYVTDAAAHLLHGALGSDDEFAFFAFHSEICTRIPPRRISGQYHILTRALQQLEVGLFQSDYQLLTQWALQERRRSLLLIMSSVSNPAGLAAIAEAILPVKARHLAILLAVTDDVLLRQQQAIANSLLDSYLIAAAKEEQERLKNSLHLLQRQGIMTIHCQAQTVSRELQYAYHMAKVSGRL